MKVREFMSRSNRVGTSSPAPGLYHQLTETDGAVHRYHLRIDPGGSGVLLVDASRGCLLSASGTHIAHRLLIDDASDEVIVSELEARYRGVDAQTLGRDVGRVRDLIAELSAGRGGDPLVDLRGPETSYQQQLSAPYAADIHAGAAHTMEKVLGALWSVGVPQVIFTEHERLDASHLVPLVERAEDLGMIVGLRTQARVVEDMDTLRRLAEAGLDHLDLAYALPDRELHDSLFGEGDARSLDAVLDHARELELCTTAVTPLLSSTLDAIDDIFGGLGAHNISTVTAYAITARTSSPPALPAQALLQAAASCEEMADAHGINLVWTPPVERERDHSLGHQVRSGPRTSSEAAIRVDEDGRVYPAQGPQTAAGHLLEDPWQQIFADPRFRSLREATDEPARCAACPGLLVCGQGCPTDPATWAQTGGKP